VLIKGYLVVCASGSRWRGRYVCPSSGKGGDQLVMSESVQKGVSECRTVLRGSAAEIMRLKLMIVVRIIAEAEALVVDPFFIIARTSY
jgi:hypothetical protein